MKAKHFVLTVAVLVLSAGASMAAEQFEPPLSLAKAAQIADAAITKAHLPHGQFLRSIRIQYLPESKYCYIASFEPPVLRGYVDGAPRTPPPPTTIHYLQVNMDGTTSFMTKTIPTKPGN